MNSINVAIGSIKYKTWNVNHKILIEKGRYAQDIIVIPFLNSYSENVSVDNTDGHSEL